MKNTLTFKSLIFVVLSLSSVSASAQRLFPANPIIVETECEQMLVKETELFLNRSDVLQYRWTNLATGDTSSEARFKVLKSGFYAVRILTAPDSLMLRDTVQVIFDAKCCRLIVPNAFTPNGDGRNDRLTPLMPKNCTITEFELQVFNRWGKLVFQTNDPNAAWDGNDGGTPAPSDVYVFRARYKAIGNNNEYGETLKGDITLIR